MHLMYVDESGDPGLVQHSSPHYILSGLIVAQDDWNKYLDRLKTFRKSLKQTYALNQRTEIHASELIRIGGLIEYRNISKTNRIKILKEYAEQLPIIFDSAKIINVYIDKATTHSQDIFKTEWIRLLQRFDTYLKKTVMDKGIVIADDTDSNKLMNLQRKMRIYNSVPSHFGPQPYNAPIDNILEDTFSRASHHSYFLQSVDVVAHLLYRKEIPKGSLKKFGIEYCFNKLEPILLKKANANDLLGIVRN